MQEYGRVPLPGTDRRGRLREEWTFEAVRWENPTYGILEGLLETEHGGVLRHRQPKGTAN